MAIDPITAAINLGTSVINRIWKDPAKQAEEVRKLQQLAQEGDLAVISSYVELLLAQIEVNKTEAVHKSLFVAGWRPFIGWCGGGAMCYQFIIYPMLMWLWALLIAFDKIPADAVPPPVLETGALFSIVTGMLGIGGMRTIERLRGVSREK